MGDLLAGKLTALTEKHPSIGEVRGLCLFSSFLSFFRLDFVALGGLLSEPHVDHREIMHQAVR